MIRQCLKEDGEGEVKFYLRDSRPRYLSDSQYFSSVHKVPLLLWPKELKEHTDIFSRYLSMQWPPKVQIIAENG
jgi:hypothetical protein